MNATAVPAQMKAPTRTVCFIRSCFPAPMFCPTMVAQATITPFTTIQGSCSIFVPVPKVEEAVRP